MSKYNIFLDINDNITKEILCEFLKDKYNILKNYTPDNNCLIISNKITEIKNSIIISETIRLGDILDKIEQKIAANMAENLLADIEINSFVLSAKMKELKFINNKIQLTEKEIAILLYFYEKREVCITKEMLLKDVWNYNSNVDTRTIETHIYRLRQKIADISGGKELIITLDDGYKLI